MEREAPGEEGDVGSGAPRLIRVHKRGKGHGGESLKLHGRGAGGGPPGHYGPLLPRQGHKPPSLRLDPLQLSLLLSGFTSVSLVNRRRVLVFKITGPGFVLVRCDPRF